MGKFLLGAIAMALTIVGIATIKYGSIADTQHFVTNTVTKVRLNECEQGGIPDWLHILTPTELTVVCGRTYPYHTYIFNSRAEAIDLQVVIDPGVLDADRNIIAVHVPGHESACATFILKVPNTVEDGDYLVSLTYYYEE